MINEDVWYRIWDKDWKSSRMVEKGEAEELVGLGYTHFVENESFYDATFGHVTVMHYTEV